MRDRNRRAFAAFFRVLVANDPAGWVIDELFRRDPSAVAEIRLNRLEDTRTFTAEQHLEVRAFFAAHVAHRASIRVDYDRDLGDASALMAVPTLAVRRRRRKAA